MDSSLKGKPILSRKGTYIYVIEEITILHLCPVVTKLGMKSYKQNTIFTINSVTETQRDDMRNKGDEE